MKEYYRYLKAFSVKKKINIILSAIIFLYEFFAAIYILFDYFDQDFIDILVHFREPLSQLIPEFLYEHFLAVLLIILLPYVDCACFKATAVYTVIFPVVYFLFNTYMFYKKRYKRDVIILNFAFQITHPAVLFFAVWGITAFFNVVFEYNLMDLL